MSKYISYSPISLISKAMFNFDEIDGSNYVASGTIRVSVSDYVDTASGVTHEINWVTTGITETLSLINQYANISFSTVQDYDYIIGGSTIASQVDVGASSASDINITLFFDSNNPSFLGISGGSGDGVLGYTGSAGDIQINYYGSIFDYDMSFNDGTASRQTLLHELGHSLGLSHPHIAFNSVTGKPTLSNDFSALTKAGFQNLGFNIQNPIDLYKEYFTIMSYDDQSPLLYNNAFTPMILDVIALQQAYGEGAGTSGSGNDTILAGTIGYRTYFDTGGTDTVDASLYGNGAYINLGVPIVGAKHLVGIVMSLYDANVTILDKGNPVSLRWLYGEFEAASGSSATDLIVGNDLNNTLSGLDGDDAILGAGGADRLNGGQGNDYLDAGVGDDMLNGEVGNDTLKGGAGNDMLDGGSDNDVLDGGKGADHLAGGSGNDTYIIDNAADLAIEAAGSGTDTIKASVNYSLSANVENLTLTGTGSVNASGNDLANKIYGNSGANTLKGGVGADALKGGAGNDMLSGGAGKDVLTGGPGQDYFVFDTAPITAAADKITDFSHVEGDKLQLSKAVFKAFSYTGTLHADDFYAAAGATKAHDATDRLIYNTTTGILYYDADGLGGSTAVQISLFGASTHPALIYGDLQIIA